MNLSQVSKSLAIDKILPWLLRVVSFPYFVFTMLYGKELFDLSDDPKQSFIIMGYLASTLAHAVVAFSIFNIIWSAGTLETWLSKILGFLSKVIAIPMIIATFIIAWHVPEFSGILKATGYFFFGYIGIALNQDDRRLGIEPIYSDPETEEKHESIYQLVFGIIAIFFILWTVVSSYTKYIYPKIPVALGGAKIELVGIQLKDRIYDAYLIQETNEWLFYREKETGQVEKIKTSLVEKIYFKKQDPNK